MQTFSFMLTRLGGAEGLTVDSVTGEVIIYQGGSGLPARSANISLPTSGYVLDGPSKTVVQAIPVPGTIW